MCYSKRNNIDPFYIEGILAGVKNGVKTLTYVDLYGSKFSDKYVATSFGRSISVPIIDATYNELMPANEIKKILIDSFRAILSRHTLMSRSISLVLVTENGIFKEKLDIEVKFDYEGYKNREDIFQ